ncbi:MAG: YebC/PmpR family DNA-binding transcriptional regulator [Chloroflexota bacterium]|nr:YebC/PmpR family DNA-binding transcriptional regulator [Chloroflexota bacterium]MDE2898545.1 YebC/PmpR family DNA-binding transcriptional regulator [Chloroflexota bacterium]
MAGHSKWAQIKRQKAVTDAKRGQLFTKLGRDLTIAAQQGGPDPTGNFRLEQAMAKAKAANMPKDNIARAIQHGVGGGSDGEQLEELLYEGYAVDGAGLLIEVVTDNRNRSVAEVRNALNRLGGTLAATGAVAWQFETRGAIEIRLDGHDPEDLELAAIDLGAIDVEHTDESVFVYTDATELARVKTELASEGAEITSAELTKSPTAPMTLADNRAARVLALIESIEDLDDVRRVHTNLELSDTLLERIGA